MTPIQSQSLLTFTSFAKFLRILSRTALILMVPLMFACSDSDDDVTGEENPQSNVVIDDVSVATVAAEGNTDIAADEEDLLVNSTFSSTVVITYGSTISITNPLADAGVTITETNGDVVVNATVSEVEYLVSGTSSSGSLKIYSEKKFKLTLNGVNITNNDGPAINIQSGKRAFIVLNDGTANVLKDGATYADSGEEDQKGTLFSEGQLIFSGEGSLTVTGNSKHAIVSDDYVRIISGTITVSDAASDGIHTNEAFIADGGTVSITSKGDGIQVEEGFLVINNGNFMVNVVDKGMSAVWDTDATIDPFVTINGGTININSSAGEGLESKSVLTINDGTINIKAADDAINAGSFIYINGGSTYAHSTGNDGIDSNGQISVTGGKTVAIGAKSPEAGFDCDRSQFKVTGGILVGLGGSTSSPTASVSTQPSVILGAGTAGQLLHIRSSAGEEVLTFEVPVSYSTMLFSSPKLASSGSYTIYIGGTVTDGASSGGLYTSGTYSGGDESSIFSTTSMVTTIGGSAGR